MNKAMLIIMDGWGIGKIAQSDAVQMSNAQYVRNLYNTYPNSTLTTCGELVGLPNGQMGNSEVGHLNLGAGRIVYQELQRINVAFTNNEFENNASFQKMIEYVKQKNKKLHLIGLVSDGGVHAHINHLKNICALLTQHKLDDQTYIHAFTDGRDTDPKSGISYLQQLLHHNVGNKIKLASVVGRFYAMDRDKRWERVKKAYDLLVHAKGISTNNLLDVIQASYDQNLTDEFLEPMLDKNNFSPIKEGDAVFCFNFRTDRCREITTALTQQAFVEQEMTPLNLHYTTMTEYDKTYKNINVIFENDDLKNTIGEVVAQNGGTQLRIAETEKYPHVTFFFSGGREQEFQNEKRIVVQSPKEVATYDLKPQMSAYEVTDHVVNEINSASPDFICLNYANADMVGHTGVWEAAIKAVETVDACVQKVVETGLQKGYTIFLTADHGNSDYMINEDGTPNTAHTLNPVPYFIIGKGFDKKLKPGKLGDVAPTLLTLMGLTIPAEMTGEVLF